MTPIRRSSVLFIFGIVLFLVVASKLLISEKYIALISGISWLDLLLATGLTLAMYFTNGFIISFLTLRKFQTRIRWADTLLLPIMMNLWGYLIPFRGGMIFSSMFLKMKYNIKISGGFALSFYTFFINLILTGWVGIYYSIHQEIIFEGLLMSIFLVLSPFIVWFLVRMLNYFISFEHPVLQKIKAFVLTVTVTTQHFFYEVKNNIVVVILTVLNVISFSILIYWSTKIFHFEMTFTHIIMYAMLFKLSIIFRIIPGNLGIQEWISGVTFYILEGDLNNGLLIGLFIRFLTVSITFTAGALGVMANMKYFRVKGLKDLWNAVRKDSV